MKWIAYLFLFMAVSVSVSAQKHDSFDVGITGTDSTYWTRVRGKSSVDIIWNFKGFSVNDATVNVYYGIISGTDTIPVLVDSEYPITFDKTDATYLNVWNQGADTVNTHGVQRDDWNYDLVGIQVIPTSALTGTLEQYIER